MENIPSTGVEVVEHKSVNSRFAIVGQVVRRASARYRLARLRFRTAVRQGKVRGLTTMHRDGPLEMLHAMEKNRGAKAN